MCDSFLRREHRVIITLGDQIFSLENHQVDWQKTARGTDLNREPSRTKQNGPKGEITTRKTAEPGNFTIAKLDVKETSLIDLLRFLADMADVNLYIDGSIKDEKVTYRLHDIPWSQAMAVILMNAQLDYQFSGGHVQVRNLLK